MAVVQHVAIRHDHVLPPIVIEIAEMRAECQGHKAWRSDSSSLGLVAEEVVTRIAIQAVYLERIIRDKQVHMAVIIVVSGSYAHSRLCSAVHPESNGLLNAILVERAIAVVDQQ